MIKRAFDIIFSLGLTIVLLPLILATAAVVAFTMGRPVIFTQPRAGLHERSFTLYKFRSMKNTNGPDGKPLPDAVRLTRTGLLLRKLSLDELPQLLNVLKGDMSIVGPRPLLPEYLPYYTPEQNARHDVKPGITGWAQVNGRHSAPFLKRLEMDVFYARNHSLLLDLRILLLTIPKVVGLEGVIEGPNIGTGEENGLNAMAALRSQYQKLQS
jgi:sugar transferase EpsL